VVSADVLCHQAVDVAAALAEVHRVLRPGGRLVLNLPAFRWLLSGHDRRVHNARRYTAGEVRALLVAHGFQAMRLRYWNSLLLPLMILRRKGPRRGAVDGGDVSDVAPFPPWQDAILFAATEIERRLALRPPAGGSVLAIATRL
jgi:SAM-dependent methyltransferase